MNVGAMLILATQGFTLLAALIAFIQSVKNSTAIREVHLSLNSRLTELIQATKVAAHAAGKAEGQQQNVNERTDR
jgi:hypothetical protein